MAAATTTTTTKKPLKFLCMHGAIANLENYKVQLDPIVKELSSDGTAEFCWLQGTHEVHPPAGFSEYFGPGPHWRWMDDEGIAAQAMLERIRDLPQGQNAEDTLRSLVPEEMRGMRKDPSPVLKQIYDFIEKEGDVEGIIGYSEGSGVGASFIMDEQRRLEREGRPRMIKCAMFFTGWPPISGEGKIMLADEDEEYVDAYTLHVIGANDPYRAGAVALYNCCDEDKAQLFDTGKGHTLPRHGKVLVELGAAVRTMVKKCRGEEA